MGSNRRRNRRDRRAPIRDFDDPQSRYVGGFYTSITKHTDTYQITPDHNVISTAAPEWVLAEKYEELTGVTCEAIRMRRKRGVWLDGKHTKVVLRRIYVNIK